MSGAALPLPARRFRWPDWLHWRGRHIAAYRLTRVPDAVPVGTFRRPDTGSGGDKGLRLSGITAVPSLNGATVAWDVSVPATGQVEYGPTPTYGLFTTKEDSFIHTHHEQIISGLTPGTTYYYRVISESAAGVRMTGPGGSFETAAGGAAYPPTMTLQTIATPSVARPAYLAVITDPTWGTEVRRITPDGSTDRNSYAKIPVENADGTLLLLGYAPSAAKVLNASTFAVLHTISPGTGAVWANTDPEVIYAAGSGDNVFRKFHYDGALLGSRTFAGYSSVSMGNGEGGISDDDRFVALQTVAGGAPGILLYDILNDVIVATVTLSEAPNNVKVSGSGQYVIANFAGDSTGSHDGLWVFEVSGSTLVRSRQLSIFGRHGDVGRDAAGNDVWVTSIDKLSSFRMDTGARIDLLPNPNAFLVGHVSCRNIDRPGWAYVSVYQGTTSIGPGKDQVAAVALDGSGDMQVFAHAHHVSAGADATYVESPFAVSNRDGTKVYFGSEWDVTGRVNMYVAGMEV